MRTIIFAGVVALALTSMAQETQAPATTPTAAAATAPAPKKVAKKAMAKKAAKKKAPPATSQVAPVLAPVAATEVAPATTAATSVATTTATAAPAKKWGAKLVLDAYTSNQDSKNISTATIDSINYVGGSYKITATETLGLRQYFTYQSASGVDNKVKQDFTVLTMGTKWGSFMGSEPVSPLFWYYLPTATATEKNFGLKADGSAVDFYGILRADFSLDWTLTPKWSVGYYLNPRQTLFPTQDTIVGGKPVLREAVSRLVHYGSVTYTVNDMIQPYFYGGFDNQMASERLTSTKDAHIAGLGANFVFFGGKLIVNPEINTEVVLKSGGVATAAPRWYQSEDLTYELVTALSF